MDELLKQIEHDQRELAILHEKVRLAESHTRARIRLICDELIDYFRANAHTHGIKKHQWKRYENHIRQLCHDAEVKHLGEEKSVWKEDYIKH